MIQRAQRGVEFDVRLDEVRHGEGGGEVRGDGGVLAGDHGLLPCLRLVTEAHWRHWPVLVMFFSSLSMKCLYRQMMRQPAQMSTRGGRKTVTRMVEPVRDIVNLNPEI